MNTDDIRLLEYYFIPKTWKIYLIDRNTEREELEVFKKLIENARLFAFDTETMPSFYQSQLSQIKPSLLQVALRNSNRTEKTVLLFDLQDIFDHKKHHSFHCQYQINVLIESIFNHSQAYKLSQSFYNDLAYLKCSYDENCFQNCQLKHLIELSDLFRRVYLDENYQQIYSLRRMTARTLHLQLDKKQQCANWSKRPLNQSLKDYAAIDVIVMIDIYDRLKTKIEQDNDESWLDFQQSIETSINLNDIILYNCVCNQRFITNKTRTKHIRTCFQAQNQIDQTIIVRSLTSKLDDDDAPPPPCGRGYLPPALKRAYQTMNQTVLCEQIRCSSSAEKCNQLNENRPPDAQFFLEDDDSEVAQAFGLEIRHNHRKPKINRIESTSSYVSMTKSNLKIAAYPPKTTDLSMCEKQKINIDENDLLDRLQDDFDSQPEFHCHLFGLGGRGRSSSLHFSPPSPYSIKRND